MHPVLIAKHKASTGRGKGGKGLGKGGAKRHRKIDVDRKINGYER